MQTSSELAGVLNDSLFLNIFWFLLFLFLMAPLAKLANKLDSRIIHFFAIFFALCVFYISIQFISNANSYFVSDALFIQLSAVDMSEGCFSLNDFGDYFRTYPFQLNLVFLYSFIYRLFGDTAPVIAQTIQAVCLSLSYYIGFHITNLLFKNQCVNIFYLICTLPFIPMYLYTLFLYGETFGVFGALLSILLFIIANTSMSSSLNRSIFCYILLTISLSFTIYVRSALLIVGIALFIIQFLLFLKSKRLLPLLLVSSVLVVTLFSRSFLSNFIVKNIGTEIGNGAPISTWIVMGMQENDMGPGYYNGYNLVSFTENNFDPIATKQEALQELSSILHNWLKQPQKFIFFLKDKALYQWCEPTYASFTVTRFMEEPSDWIYDFYYKAPNYRARQFLNRYQSIVYFLIFGALVSIVKKREHSLSLLPGLIFIGGFLFSLIWEGKSRYVYPYIVIIMPYLAKGILFYLEQLSLCVKMIISGLTTKDKKKTSEVTQ